ncbi:hypothetical protein STSP2_01183 [Anaerohalosphaera lusitana]|uniref:PhoD-like phosphatase n=1 Tax=Anaerohalosphaera lusitana TaxID=1936003 RepID=A0A1U9NJC8_9BACT|nr:hypothetical protein [Anaerohalosphaera lusitana]AQT68029.1 hypothetical protein STSP2_01183 [Anaerohalosphaera lusitana]
MDIAFGKLKGLGIAAVLIIVSYVGLAGAGEFTYSWDDADSRTWVGKWFWANRLQDWRVDSGRLECVEVRQQKPLRTCHVLAARLNDAVEGFSVSAKVGTLKPADECAKDAVAGFLVGAAGDMEYRSAALVHHSPGKDGGLIACVTPGGKLQFRDMTEKKFPVIAESDGTVEFGEDGIVLKLAGIVEADGYIVELSGFEAGSDEAAASVSMSVKAADLAGNAAMLSHPGSGKNTAGFWFNDLSMSGDKFDVHRNRTCGPVIFTQYTLSDGTVKLSAQMMPLGDEDSRNVVLEEKINGEWKKIASSEWEAPSYVALFRMEDWDTDEDHKCRVVYAGGKDEGENYYDIIIRREPMDKEEITVAGFSCVHNNKRGLESGFYDWNMVWFPHSSVTDHARSEGPDLSFFSGDQVYEFASPTRIDAQHLCLDYLYKWYIFCWAFRDLTWDMPSVCIPDDHDVYQGNLWGQGGRHAKRQGLGGYVWPADFVKMVERTQTCHLPDPYDPTPVDQGIGVYYTNMNYGGVSFAILEDRKFKTGPKSEEALSKDPTKIHLLGERQLKFLEDWSGDWAPGVDMKCVLTQTPYVCLHTGWGWGKRLFQYSPPSEDFDSGGWPPYGRNKALRKIRKGFAFMIAGDQHLGSLVHQGIEEFDDAVWSFCVPAVGNYYPRAWYPSVDPEEKIEGLPAYAGKYHDNFGNPVSVWAVANPNPVGSGVEPGALNDFVPGYGTVVFNKTERTITSSCWPRSAKIGDEDGEFKGWSKTVDMLDNYSPKDVAWLGTVKVSGFDKPVLQLIDGTYGEVVYTLRLPSNTFRPWAPKPGNYYLKIGQPGSEQVEILTDLKATAEKTDEVIEVRFENK